MGDFWNVPGDRKPRQFGGKFVVHFAPAELRRFFGNKNRPERFFGVRFEKLGELLMDFFCIDISHHDERQIVRHVPRFVILHHLFLRQLIVDFHLPNDRQPVGMTLICGSEKKLPSHPIRVVKSHRKFTPDHFLFFQILVWRQG